LPSLIGTNIAIHARDGNAQVVEHFDRMIAAHGISSRSVLITANVAGFTGLPGLTIENWATP
jgi:predicted nucleic acid-binding protein